MSMNWPDPKQLNDSQRQALLALARVETRPDLATLEAALKELGPDRPVQLTTTPGSDNDRLWAQMAALDWMAVRKPLDIAVSSSVYEINPTAEQEIRDFLA